MVGVLEFVAQTEGALKTTEGYFDFRYANLYLTNVLAFNCEGDKPKVHNTHMRARKYRQLQLAVRLLKTITASYLAQKRQGFERLPY